jgi:molecular chaperone DnaK (HSP70)
MAWVLAVDFGTTNTVAAIADPSGVRVLTVNGRPVTASAVFLHDDGWYVGDAAIRMARHRLDRFEACPKRAIPDGSLFLGGVDVPVGDAITELFRPLLAEAQAQHNGQPPALFVVTHPAPWTAGRIEVLLRAAAQAARGWPRPLPLPEPVAAAQRVPHIENMPPTARMVVLDLGGGTTDVTVVDRHGDHLTVVGTPLGRDGLGGVDFDLRLARCMVAEVNAPGLYDRLAGSPDPELRERAVDIRDHARDVKEQLSQQAVVPAQLPKSPPELPTHTPVHVNRSMLEQLIRGTEQEPGLSQAVALVDDALRAASPGPPMAGVFLVGGSSRIPLLGQLVTHRTGRVPIRHGDPTTAVAEGAARYGWGVLHGEHERARQAPPVAMPPPMPRPVVQPTRGHGGKVALLVVLVLLLVGGAIFAVTELSDLAGGGGGDPTFTTTPSAFGTAVGPVWVYESPSLSAATVYALSAGETVRIRCTCSGDPVQNNVTGQVSTLWNGIDGGYVPDVMLNTGTTEPTMPPC